MEKYKNTANERQSENSEHLWFVPLIKSKPDHVKIKRDTFEHDIEVILVEKLKSYLFVLFYEKLLKIYELKKSLRM